VVTSISATSSRAAPQVVEADIDVEYRRLGGVFLPLGLEMTLARDNINAIQLHFSPYGIVPMNSDFRMVASVSANDTQITGTIAGYLCEVHGDV